LVGIKNIFLLLLDPLENDSNLPENIKYHKKNPTRTYKRGGGDKRLYNGANEMSSDRWRKVADA
jgi:hypothetical protein